jgi:hypothetical protein
MNATAVRTIAISSAVIVGLCLGGAQHAEAQTRARTIGPAVFGGTGTRADRPGGLDLFGQLFVSYDDDVLADQSAGGPDRPRSANASEGREGLYSGFFLGLQYLRLGESTNVHLETTHSLNYYPDIENLTTSYHQAGATFVQRFGSRYSIRARPFAAYSPHYSMRLFLAPLPLDPDLTGSLDGAVLAAPDVDSTIIQRESFRYGGNAEFRMLVARHSTLNVGYNYTKTDLSRDPIGSFDVQSIGANLSHRLSESASLRVGYTLDESTYEGSDAPSTRIQNVNIGIDYRKPLSRSRRSFLRFTTGSIISEQVAGISEPADGRRIQAIGSASLVHQMGRTWNAQAQYRREVGYLEGFAQPVFSDSANVAVSGLITRRLDLSLNANYITGSSAIRRDSPNFDSYSATARLRRALHRTLAVYVEYLFYHYNFHDVADRPFGLPREFSRNGARVGLSLWLPLTD